MIPHACESPMRLWGNAENQVDLQGHVVHAGLLVFSFPQVIFCHTLDLCALLFSSRSLKCSSIYREWQNGLRPEGQLSFHLEAHCAFEAAESELYRR